MSNNPTYENARIVRRRRIINRAWRLLDRMRRDHKSEDNNDDKVYSKVGKGHKC